MRRNRWNVRSLRAGALASCFAAAFVSLASPPAHAQPPQVTLYLNNYGQPPGAPVAGPVQVAPSTPAAGAAAAYQGEAALAQMAAYQQYLLYLSLAREGALAPASSASTAQYFTNGAAVTTVPSAGQPGSAYYSNGAEATRLPPVPSAAPSAATPLPAPSSSALPPYWWTGSPAPSASTAAPPPLAPAAPSAAAAPAAAPAEAPPTQGPVMSFQEWLQSMGAQPAPEPPANLPALTAAEVEAPLVEPVETAYEVRPRATYAPPEKARERGAENTGSGGIAAFVVGAFAVGLLLGGIAMWRAGFRMGPPGGAASG